VGERDADTPAYPVFKRDGETIRHFYSGEGNAGMADPGQDPHNALDMNPLRTILDTTPDRRGDGTGGSSIANDRTGGSSAADTNAVTIHGDFTSQPLASASSSFELERTRSQHRELGAKSSQK